MTGATEYAGWTVGPFTVTIQDDDEQGGYLINPRLVVLEEGGSDATVSVRLLTHAGCKRDGRFRDVAIAALV